MASTETTSIPVTPELRAHLERVFARAEAEGVDLTYERMGGRRARSNAAAIRWSLKLAAEGAGGTTAAQAAPRVDRASVVRKARQATGITPTQLAQAAGCSAGHVRAVESGSVPLNPHGALARFLVSNGYEI